MSAYLKTSFNLHMHKGGFSTRIMLLVHRAAADLSLCTARPSHAFESSSRQKVCRLELSMHGHLGQVPVSLLSWHLIQDLGCSV